MAQILSVIPPKRVDFLLRVLERREPMHVQTFLPEPPVVTIRARVDAVLHQNRRIEWTYILLTVARFGTGIACFVTALVLREFAWSTPSAITTGMLYWPLREIKEIRQKNIALATAPMLITQLPTDEAVVEIQKLLKSLYGEESR